MKRAALRLAACLALLLLCALAWPRSDQAAEAIIRPPLLSDPDVACAQCHQAIYTSYRRTPMAQGSGLATDGLIPGNLHHQPSATDYRVFVRDRAAWMSFDQAAEDIHGERQLLYFIGSGRRGRTYLYQVDGQYFELPINFYNRRNGWDMAPAYEQSRAMPAPLPTDSNCLHCHASQVQQPLPTARNRYAAAPFLQAGVGCAACHGDPTQHLAQKGHGPILNPAKLSAVRRDSTCLQCHLEGDAVVYRPGKSLAQFQPGEDLADTALYFVRASRETGGSRATSQYEALLRSACKRASGDKLTCTTCHDPHSTPAPAERVAYFRARCLACHTTPAIAVAHHPEQPDCATCHMPTRATSDISHEQLTDHNIQARPNAASLTSLAKTEDLIPVGAVTAGDREYGLAYAQLAHYGDRNAGERALRLLSKAVENGATDSEAETQLAFLQQISAHPNQAGISYDRALKQNPFDPTALANLAVLDASTGKIPEAVALLKTLVQNDPSQTAPGLNLAFIECRLGQKKEALALLNRLAILNPADPQLRTFLHSGAYAGQRCVLTAAPSPE